MGLTTLLPVMAASCLEPDLYEAGVLVIAARVHQLTHKQAERGIKEGRKTDAPWANTC